LGHKSLLSTQRYAEGEELHGKEYYSAKAKIEEEARKLIEVLHNHATDTDFVQLFRKSKRKTC